MSNGRTLSEGEKVCGEIQDTEKWWSGLSLLTCLDKFCMGTETMELRMEP